MTNTNRLAQYEQALEEFKQTLDNLRQIEPSLGAKLLHGDGYHNGQISAYEFIVKRLEAIE